MIQQWLWILPAGIVFLIVIGLLWLGLFLAIRDDAQNEDKPMR